MLRVVRPGGRIAMANWTPGGFIGRLFKVIGAHVPPPPGVQPPSLWGTEPHIVELFGTKAAQIRCERRLFNFRYRSAAHWVQVFRDLYGPMHKAFGALDDNGAQSLERAITALLDELNVAGPDSLVVPGEYLEVVIIKTETPDLRRIAMANAGRLQQATTVNASALIRSLVARVARSASLRDTTRRTRESGTLPPFGVLQLPVATG